MFYFFQDSGQIAGFSNAAIALWKPVVLLILLLCSAFFSGSETAFFNLSRRQIRMLRQSQHKLDNLVSTLLNKPRQLLCSLLFGNMVVNVLFFAIISVIVFRLEHQGKTALSAAVAFLGFVVLVILGEIIPKSVAYANSKTISTAAALPAFLCMELLRPFVFVFKFLIAEPVLRLLLGPDKMVRQLSTNELRALIEQVHKSGLITADEDKLLSEIIELGFLKVRHVMRPRVDIIACAVTKEPKDALELMRKNNMTKMPVYAGRRDNIVGLVEIRDLLLKSSGTLGKITRRVNFVPEQKKVESLLEFFRSSGTDTAIVVDEYGGIAGWVSLEDIAEQLLGPIETASQQPIIEQVGPFEYRLSGNLALHDWAGSFGVDPLQSRFATIGGMVTTLLGRIPRTGDTARMGNLKFTVERMRKHRIETILLTIESITDDA